MNKMKSDDLRGSYDKSGSFYTAADLNESDEQDAKEFRDKLDLLQIDDQAETT
jgi:hypothetical protein